MAKIVPNNPIAFPPSIEVSVGDRVTSGTVIETTINPPSTSTGLFDTI